MITAVDSSVLIDVFRNDPSFGQLSARALATARRAGVLLACDIVWAEVGGFFDSPAAAEAAFSRAGLSFDRTSPEAALHAGMAWRSYRIAGGSRERLVPGFLVGAHALYQADALLSRDRGFVRRYFPELRLIDPSVS